MFISAWIYIPTDALSCSSVHQILMLSATSSATPSTHIRANFASRSAHTWNCGSLTHGEYQVEAWSPCHSYPSRLYAPFDHPADLPYSRD
jgi:hypothetical protein